MNPRLALLAALLIGSTALAGCLGGAQQAAAPTENLTPGGISDDTREVFEELTQVIPSNYTFAGQEALESVVVWLNDTIDQTADLAVESPADDGGMNFQTIVRSQDVTQYIPPLQATEIHIVLFWYGNPGQSVDLDIWTDLPGTRTHLDRGTGQEMNWNIPVKRMVVNTVGVPGETHAIGVQATNGRILPGQAVQFFLQLSFDYTKDVLTPYHPYAFTLPEGATGIVLRSQKVTGDEHLQAAFVVIDPNDELVSYTEYDDIAIPTESVFIPLRQPGEYIFYAYFMRGGFLSMKADVPVALREVRTLPLRMEEVVDFTNPLAPGTAQHDIVFQTGTPLDGVPVSTPYQEGAKAASFTVDTTFPLRIWGFFSGDQTVAGDAEVRITNAKGIVYRAVRSLRADLGDQGSLGWSGDAFPFRMVDNSLLGKGAYSVGVVSDGYTGEIGHGILTYERTPAPSGGA